jgi:Domain of unknown function (DUF5916)/Carbohydrate family 9 binding domain-like
MRRIALVAALLAISLPHTLLAQNGPGAAPEYPVEALSLPRPELRALRIEGGIEVDGRLDEDAWARATPSTETWIQITPNPGMPSSERTIVRVVYDDKSLYVGAVLYDSAPDKLIVPGLEQDFETQSSDIFGFALDTYHDEQNGFVFAVNPAGAVFDAQAFDDQRSIVRAWEGISKARTSVNDSSWIVEMEIPFATLRFNPNEEEQTWGLNFSRRIRRRNEDSMWSPVPRQFRVYKFSMAGTLTGLRNLPAGRNLWVKPYVLADRLSGVKNGIATNEADGGLDVKWGITPRMTLDLTANTDFSQVEVDAEQVNLTRFSLFFPEKRDFFLENEGTFAFQDVSIRNFRMGSSSRKFRLFHSRRVGLSDGRAPVPILGGARLTGRIGERFEVGLLDMQTRSLSEDGATTGQNSENFAVARIKGHLGGGSTVGLIFVNRQETGTGPTAADFNRAIGVDGNFNLSQNVVLSAYAARTDERDPVGDDPNTAMVQLARRGAIWDTSLLFKHVGDGFNPRVGFIDRTSVRRYFGTVGAHPKIRRASVLEVNPYVDVDVFTTLEDALETRSVKGGLSFLFMNGGTLVFEYADRYERLFEATRIAGAELVTGTYRWREPSVRFVAPGSKTVSGSLRLSSGDFYDGRRTSIAATARYRPNEHLSIDAGLQHNNLTLGGQDFTADLFSGRIRYARDTRTFFMGFVQYNEAADELITNARFNLIHAPLSDVFIVYTERRSLADNISEPVLERGLTLKVTKLLAF